MFITFEGINGCGKSTQSKKLVETLIGAGFEVIQTKEPGGGTEFCQEIRRSILFHPEISTKTELFAFYADRNEHLEKVILPALKDNKIVVCDRYVDSTYAYQCYGENAENEQFISTLHSIAGNVMPDITFLIDISVEESTRRIADWIATSEKKYDLMPEKTLQEIRSAYLKLAEKFKDRIVLINGEKSKQEVFQDIWNIVSAKISK